MREIHTSAIVDAVKKLCIDANLDLEPDMLRAFDRALTTERSPAGKQVLQILKDNAQMAKTKRIPYCQDTGFVICFVELGQDVHVDDGRRVVTRVHAVEGRAHDGRAEVALLVALPDTLAYGLV